MNFTFGLIWLSHCWAMTTVLCSVQHRNLSFALQWSVKFIKAGFKRPLLELIFKEISCFSFRSKYWSTVRKCCSLWGSRFFLSQMAESRRLMLTALNSFICLSSMFDVCLIYLPVNNDTTGLQTSFSDNILLSSVKCWVITAYFTRKNRQMWPVLNGVCSNVWKVKSQPLHISLCTLC